MNRFKEIIAKDDDLNRVQRNLTNALTPITGNVILDGVLLSGISLSSGVTAGVPHTLQRIPVGYIVTDKNAVADIMRVSWDSNFINLQSSANVTVNLWVF